MKIPCYRHIRSSDRHTVRPQPGHEAADSVIAHFPDLSGAAPFDEDRLLVVRDLKQAGGARLSLVQADTGEVTELSTEWHGAAGRDLEALTPLRGLEGEFLAIEAAPWREFKAYLHELSVDQNGAEVLRRHELPDFGQEIEGLAEKPLPNGDRLLILGGRGTDKGERGRLYWGILDRQQGRVHFSDAGVTGLEIDPPDLPGNKQRDISDLHLATDGTLWATTCTDNGDDGPFDSAVYTLGKVGDTAIYPIAPQTEFAHPVTGTKLEAMAAKDEHGLYLGSDNENFGGQWGYLAFDCGSPKSGRRA